MLFLIVVLVLLYCGWVRDDILFFYKNTQIFDLPNTIQIVTSIYFGPVHGGIVLNYIYMLDFMF